MPPPSVWHWLPPPPKKRVRSRKAMPSLSLKPTPPQKKNINKTEKWERPAATPAPLGSSGRLGPWVRHVSRRRGTAARGPRRGGCGGQRGAAPFPCLRRLRQPAVIVTTIRGSATSSIRQPCRAGQRGWGSMRFPPFKNIKTPFRWYLAKCWEPLNPKKCMTMWIFFYNPKNALFCFTLK